MASILLISFYFSPTFKPIGTVVWGGVFVFVFVFVFYLFGNVSFFAIFDFYSVVHWAGKIYSTTSSLFSFSFLFFFLSFFLLSLGLFFGTILGNPYVSQNPREFMHLILWNGFWFVHIPFDSMVEFLLLYNWSLRRCFVLLFEEILFLSLGFPFIVMSRSLHDRIFPFVALNIHTVVSLPSFCFSVCLIVVSVANSLCNYSFFALFNVFVESLYWYILAKFIISESSSYFVDTYILSIS